MGGWECTPMGAMGELMGAGPEGGKGMANEKPWPNVVGPLKMN